jgi:hypothetical protein
VDEQFLELRMFVYPCARSFRMSAEQRLGDVVPEWFCAVSPEEAAAPQTTPKVEAAVNLADNDKVQVVYCNPNPYDSPASVVLDFDDLRNLGPFVPAIAEVTPDVYLSCHVLLLMPSLA